MNHFKEHIFNASYLAIFLYGVRRIVRRIRPISFTDAYDFIEGLLKRPGVPVYLVHKDGTYYHVANSPAGHPRDVSDAIASAFGGNVSSRCWSRVTVQKEPLDPRKVKIVENTPITKLLPPEMYCRIPSLARSLKKAYGEGK
jgi:hypothetical protein